MFKTEEQVLVKNKFVIAKNKIENGFQTNSEVLKAIFEDLEYCTVRHNMAYVNIIYIICDLIR